MPTLCSIYDSFYQSSTQSRYPFDRFAFSYWKGNESIPHDPQSSFKASNPLLLKTFSSASSIFFPPLSFHSPASSIDQSIRSFAIHSLHTLQNPDQLANTLLASLGPDPESQAALLCLIRFFPSLRPHFSSLLSLCCDLQAPVHSVIQLFEWWMFCELVWKEHAIRSFTISDALDSPIAVQYETLWKLDALHWLVEERHIGAIGHETADTDAPGANVNFAGEIYILETDRLQVELMTNLDALPPTGAVIFVTFPKVKNGVGFPARVFAVYLKE